MNEEIIDGVDVSGCRFFIKEYIEDGYTEDDGCVYIKNACEINGTECCIVVGCYYKQLKRLEQKLNKIKEITTKYSQREDYLLGGLYADLVDGLNEVLKDD